MVSRTSTRQIHFVLVLLFMVSTISHLAHAEDEVDVLALGLSSSDYSKDAIPEGWHLRHWSTATWDGQAIWISEEGNNAVKLHSKNALTFLEKKVDIDLSEYPVVS